MKYVLDASVALKTVLNETDSAATIALMDGFKLQVHELSAPDTLPVEMAHALTRAERRRVIKQGEASVLLASFLRSCPALHPHRSFLARAIDLSSQMRIGVYDCLYVALAERELCKVVTSDQRVIALFPNHAVALHALP